MAQTTIMSMFAVPSALSVLCLLVIGFNQRHSSPAL
jgi:hypothetical protein